MTLEKNDHAQYESLTGIDVIDATETKEQPPVSTVPTDVRKVLDINKADFHQLEHHLITSTLNLCSAVNMIERGTWNEEVNSMLQKDVKNHIDSAQIYIPNVEKVDPRKAALLEDFFETVKETLKTIDRPHLEILNEKSEICKKEIFNREEGEKRSVSYNQEILRQPFSSN